MPTEQEVDASIKATQEMLRRLGGSAFPVPDNCGCDTGMHLRDYFATAAMPLVINADDMHRYMKLPEFKHLTYAEQQQAFMRQAAERAYAMADAMMVARELP